MREREREGGLVIGEEEQKREVFRFGGRIIESSFMIGEEEIKVL